MLLFLLLLLFFLGASGTASNLRDSALNNCKPISNTCPPHSNSSSNSLPGGRPIHSESDEFGLIITSKKSVYQQYKYFPVPLACRTFTSFFVSDAHPLPQAARVVSYAVYCIHVADAVRKRFFFVTFACTFFGTNYTLLKISVDKKCSSKRANDQTPPLRAL